MQPRATVNDEDLRAERGGSARPPSYRWPRVGGSPTPIMRRVSLSGLTFCNPGIREPAPSDSTLSPRAIRGRPGRCLPECRLAVGVKQPPPRVLVSDEGGSRFPSRPSGRTGQLSVSGKRSCCACPSSRARSIPGQAQVEPPWGQWMMYRSTCSIPSRSRLRSISATGSLRAG